MSVSSTKQQQPPQEVPDTTTTAVWWKSLPFLGSNNKTNQQICDSYTQLYRSKFPDVQYLSSRELLAWTAKHGATATVAATTTTRKEGSPSSAATPVSPTVILVDVRSPPERQISMLEGAMTLEEFEQSHHVRDVDSSTPPPPLETDAAATTASANPDTSKPATTKIVTYCTIGYRSGMAARRLALQYPHLAPSLHSLDGIVAYTHAVAEYWQGKKEGQDTNHEENEENANNPPPSLLRLTHPTTGEVTEEIHVFGSLWACTSHLFTPIHFAPPELLYRLLEVMVALMSCQYLQLLMYGKGLLWARTASRDDDDRIRVGSMNNDGSKKRD